MQERAPLKREPSTLYSVTPSNREGMSEMYLGVPVVLETSLAVDQIYPRVLMVPVQQYGQPTSSQLGSSFEQGRQQLAPGRRVPVHRC